MKTFFAILLLALPLASLASQENSGVIRSDSGKSNFQGSDLQIVVALLSDYEETLKEWDRPDSLEVPKIETKTKFVTGDTIVPFITFASKTSFDGPLFVDADLIMPDGSISEADHSPSVVLTKKIRADGNFYREDNIFGFGISKRYPSGSYVVRLKVYNSTTVFSVFEETFQLN